MTRKSILGPYLLLFLVASAAGPAGAAGQLSEPLSPCALDGVEGPARCGGVEVAEDPDRPGARRIGLRVAVLPSRSGDPTGAPLAVLAGGPGAAATGLAGFAARTFDALRDDHEILLVDARGTGGSHSLDCPSFARGSSPADYTGALFSAQRVRSCRAGLTGKADLERYTTRYIADDMVRVWRALGHDRVNVYATSYGTRLAQELMRRHPGSLRAVVLKGVAPVELRVPYAYPRDGQASLDRIFEHCRAEAACAGAYPRLETELVEVLAALEEGVEVRLRHPATGEAATVRLHRPPVTQALMAGLQSTGLAVYLPRMIHAAARGAWEPLAGFALFYRVTLAGELSEGLFLSVTCAEDVPYIDLEVAAAVAEDTFLGLARYRDQAAACEIWDVPPVDPGFHEPVTSAVPTLLVSGVYDPVTPPRWGWRMAGRLENAFHLVVPEGSHSFSGMTGCVDRVIARFVRSGTPPARRDACVDEVRLGSFSLPEDPWPPPLAATRATEDSDGAGRTPRARSAPRQPTVPADHHVHVWSERARDLLVEAQRRTGQAVVGEDEMRVLDGDDVVAALDSAGIRTGVVLSTAYFFGMPEVEVEDEAARVRAENEYVARQVAGHPDRLVGFFSVNPMADYAMDEIEHWADRDAFVGLKLHLGNSDVSLRDANAVARLREVFRRADELGLAVAIHLGGRSQDFGAADARAFVDEVLPAAPSVPVQVAHMAGPGGLGPGTRASLDVFAEALREHPERTRNLIFDLSGVPNPRYLARGDTALIRRVDALNEMFVEAVRKVGLDRVVYGTDYPLVAMARYLDGLREDLPLSEAEIRDLLDDPAPYLR